MKYENKVITFGVNEYLTQKIEIKKKAGALAQCLLGVQKSEKDFLEEVYIESVKATENVIDRVIKDTKEINAEKIIVDNINNMLKKLKSNLRLRQFIYITKDLSVSHSVYLCGNGYFKKIYQLSDIQIPCQDYYGYEHEEEWKAEYQKGYLYICDETTTEEISLSINFDDGIDYDQSYLDVLSAVLSKNKVVATQDVIDWIDVRSEDSKIDADMSTDDIADLFLIGLKQTRVDRSDTAYEICLQELNKIVEQIYSR